MADFGNNTVLFTCFYMPCDSSSNCDSFNSAFGTFQTLRARHGPNYVICGGDFNVQLSRLHSNQSIMFETFCSAEDLISAHTICCYHMQPSGIGLLTMMLGQLLLILSSLLIYLIAKINIVLLKML